MICMHATVIIPTFNRWEALQQTLEALARIDYPADKWEVIIVDDGSTDETEARAAEWIKQAAINVGYIKQANSGPAVARNRAASQARGEVLIFIDNDILVRPEFVRAHVDAIAANPGCWVMGRIVHQPELLRSPFGRYRDALWETFHETHSSGGAVETTGMTAANVSIPTLDFRRLGGFDESFTIASCEDCDLAIRARQSGIRILYDPAIVAVHNDWAVSLAGFCERQRLYSISDVLLWRKYGSASPRSNLVRENAPIDWRYDEASLVLKKTIKRVLATRAGFRLVKAVGSLVERVAPDTRLSKRAYDVAVGAAIFKGVREGLRRYPAEGPTTEEESRQIVCHLIDANLDTSYFRSIARNHDHSRYPVIIGSLAVRGPLQEAMNRIGTPTFSLNASSRWDYPLATLRLAKLLRRERVSILHAHCFDATVVGLTAARIAGVRFVFTRHHSDHNIRLGKRWHTKIDSWCARRADHVIAVSEATRKVMTDIESVPPEQISVVYNGMEPLERPAESQVEQTRRELGLAGETVCLMLGRLHEEKGHLVLFEAIPSVLSRVGKVVFLLAGEGPHRSMLEQEVRLRGLEDSVRFLGRRDDVPELISLASLLVLPSLAESFGFVVLEAMSLDKPVVAAATGGIPELITDCVNGLLIPPKDPGALADAISRVIEDVPLARRLCQSGLKSVEAFSFDRMMRGYERVYDQMLTASLSEPVATQPSAHSARSRIAG